MRKLTILGAGSAFTLDDYQTNYLITHEYNDETINMLVDCGGDARHALNKIGMGYKDITDVYISHLHNDHIGGLEWLGFAKFFDPTDTVRPRLWITADQADKLWTNALSAGMSSIQGRVTTMDDFFDVRPLQINETFALGDLRMQPVQTVHIMNGFHIVPSYGLLIENDVYTGDAKVVFITTDTQFCPHQIQDFYNMADIVIHDCEMLYFPEPFKSGVHSHYEDLKTLPEDTKKKIWLTHYQDNNLKAEDALIDGFLGLGVAGQVIEF